MNDAGGTPDESLLDFKPALIKKRDDDAGDGNPFGPIVLVAVLVIGAIYFFERNGEDSQSSYPAPTMTILENQHTAFLVRLTNNGDDAYYTGQGDFRLRDASGLSRTPDLTGTYWSGEGFPSLEEIHGHESLQGWLVFDMPNEGLYVLIYRFQSWRGFGTSLAHRQPYPAHRHSGA